MERRGFIGGSDAVKLMDKKNWFDLWEVKTGRKKSDDLSDILAVQMGNHTESFNMKWLANRLELPSDTEVRTQSVYEYKCYDILFKASVDFEYYEKVESFPQLVECKHTYAHNTMRNVIDLYMPQLQHYMYTSNQQDIILSVFFGNNQHDYKLIKYNSDVWLEILETIKEFWNYVRANKAPDKNDDTVIKLNTDKIKIDGLIAKDMQSNNQFMDAVHSYMDTKDSVETHEKSKKLLKEMMTSEHRELYCDQLRITKNKAGHKMIKLLDKKEDAA